MVEPAGMLLSVAVSVEATEQALLPFDAVRSVPPTTWKSMLPDRAMRGTVLTGSAMVGTHIKQNETPSSIPARRADCSISLCLY